MTSVRCSGMTGHKMPAHSPHGGDSSTMLADSWETEAEGAPGMKVHTDMRVHTCGRQVSLLDVFLYPSPPYFLSQSLSRNQELGNSARLAEQQASRMFLSSPHHHSGYRCSPLHPAFYTDTEDPNSGPRVCTACTLPPDQKTELDDRCLALLG